MKTYILIYNECALFETIMPAYLLKTAGDVVTVGISSDAITTVEGFKLVPHITIDSVSVDDMDLFIVPGGNIDNINTNKHLKILLGDLKNKGKHIAAICAGVNVLQDNGLLDGKQHILNNSEEKVIVDGTLITAKPDGYIDFGITLGKVFNIYKDEADLQETIDFFK